MSRRVILPPPHTPDASGLSPAGWWHDDPVDGRIVCDLCPRECRLKPGDRGFCFVRQNVDGAMMLTTYGRSTGFCIDPIEKKPLNHFHPGTSVLSFGTAGCNLGCKFCQNWDISKSREVERLSESAGPEAIAEAARRHGCRSVAFTYNDPVIWAEYAIDVARACRAVGVQTVAVTAGYITPEARGPFYEVMDAANVDLKSFSEDFYEKITYSRLQPVLDTLAWLKSETDVWFEITNLIIPQANDAMDEIRRMSGWILDHCGAEVPLHFTAFHPDFRMRDRGPTPRETLLEAYHLARSEGLKHVYVGNVDDAVHQSTYCPHCGKLVIERNWYELGAYHLDGDRCRHCGGAVAGRFDAAPGTWGRKRLPVEIARFETPVVHTIQPPNREQTMTAETHADPVSGPPLLSDDQRAAILRAACEYIAAAIANRPPALPDPSLAGAADVPVIGAYVTLKRRGQLRACCGLMGTARPLIQALEHAAVRTAKDDHRLPPISATELPFLDVDVNLLHNLRPVEATGRARLAAVEVGRHGLRIQRGDAGGLLLPGVAVENGWDAESFLRHIGRKAGLPTTAWEDDQATLFTFEAVEFDGPFASESLPETHPAPGMSPDWLRRIAALARENVVALARGMAPSYYMPGLPDGNVAGLVLSLDVGAAAPEPLHFVQLALRPGVPFQATLFGLCEAAARAAANLAGRVERLDVGVTVLTDPAMHGTLAAPDLRGLDPARRTLLTVEGDKNSWAYDPACSPDELLAVARGQIHVLTPDRAPLYSFDTSSTESRLVFRTAPRAVPRAGGARPPGVAGRFYPDSAEKLDDLVDQLLSSSESHPERWAAAMIPHAGLVYSGKVAAAVLNRLEFPERVIIIGPKHTRLGVDWAVMPQDEWTIPGRTIAADPELAAKLVEAIPGLELDAAAHHAEHAIEVELPLLARLAPRCRVTGIAVGGGNLELCRRFAEGLAAVVRELPSPPLLLISSDMNHFATDRENRRLDETALAAMETLDPTRLLETVQEHDISMCGVLPAVIVMETLRLLGGLTTCERVAYATSGDVTGQLDRVVGYAGVLLR